MRTEVIRALLDAEWNTAIEAAANVLRDGRSQFAVRQLKRKVKDSEDTAKPTE